MGQLNKLTPADLQTSERLRRQTFIDDQASSTKPDTSTEATAFRYYQTRAAKLSGVKNKRKKIAKISPLVLLMLVIYGGLSLLSFLNPPLATLTRLASDTFNTQDVAVDARLMQLLNYKLSHDPDEPVKYQILADYREITPELSTRLKREEIHLDQSQNIATYKGKKIYGDQFVANLNNDLGLIKAFEDSTAIRRTIFQDDIWQEYKKETKLNQSGIWIDNPESTLREQELAITKANTAGFRFNTGSDGNNNFGGISDNLAKLNKTADELSKSKLTPNGKSFVNLIFVDQPNETCGLYQTTRAVQDYQKTAQATQLSKLASFLLSESDKMKAGEADSEVINSINDRLTYSGFYFDGSGKKQNQKSAMDSYAQRFLSGGVGDSLDSSAQKYVIGANEPLAHTIVELKRQGESDNCSKSASFSFKNIFLSIWNFLTGRKPSDEATRYLTDDVKLNTTSTSLSAMTGLATAPDFSGEDLANGFASGMAELMNNNAKNSGLSILTKSQAISYLTAQQNLIARRAEIDRRTMSPFDTRSPYTFLGSIAARLNSLSTQKSLPSKISAFTLVARQSILNNDSPVMASSEQISATLSQCHDPDYREANPDIALGPYCNVIYGVPVETLSINPESVIYQLVKTGNLEIIKGSCDANDNFCQLASAGALKDFEDNCLNRTSSIGIANDKNNKGENCIVTDDTEKLFSIYLVDRRINSNLEWKRSSDTPSGDSAWPVPNSILISSTFGWREGDNIVPRGMHNGVDIPAPNGSPVVAAHSGSVTFVGNDSSGGLGIEIQTDDKRVKTSYWHLSATAVKTGQQVKTGQKIGEVGSTGVSTGPHLHFEYQIDGSPVNPMLFINHPSKNHKVKKIP